MTFCHIELFRKTGRRLNKSKINSFDENSKKKTVHRVVAAASGVRRIFQWGGGVFKSDIKNLFAIYTLANK